MLTGKKYSHLRKNKKKITWSNIGKQIISEISGKYNSY